MQAFVHIWIQGSKFAKDFFSKWKHLHVIEKLLTVHLLIWSLGGVFCVPTSTSLEIYTYDLSLNNFWYIKHKNPFLEKVSISEDNFYKYNSGHVHKTTAYSHVQKSIENWSVCSKMALGEVDVSLPWWCHTLVLLAPG